MVPPALQRVGLEVTARVFIIILVGALVAWSTLGEDLEAQLRGGTGTVSETLSGRTGVAPSTPGNGTPRPPAPSTPPQGSGSGASSNKRALTGR